MVQWTTIPQVRKVAGVSLTEFTDLQIEDLIASAQKEVNAKLIVKYIRELVNYIDPYRSNDINGTNTTFFVKNWKGNYLGDFNFDNVIDTSDIKVIQYDPNTQTETELTVSSIDIDNCSFTLSAAPNNVQLYVDYAVLSLDPEFPDGFISQVTTYLSASYLFVGTDGWKYKFGNVSVDPGQLGGKGKQLYDKYLSLLDQININQTGGAIYGSMSEKI